MAALLLGIGLAVMLSRQHPPAFSFGAGTVPFVLVTAYVLILRQGKPKPCVRPPNPASTKF